MKTKPIFLFVALTLATSLFASNVITYTATEKLLETIDSWNSGLHTDAFNVSISSHTFSNGTGTITFSGEVTKIGNSAFYDCSGLTSVTIPSSVTTIGDRAFSNCSGLTSVTIPNSVTTIGDHAFYYCSGLTSVTIGNSVTTIGDRAFSNCSGLKSIDVATTNTHYTSVDGVLFNYTKDTLVQCPIGNPRTEYAIPNSVTTIGESAFSWCSGLTSVTIGNSVTTIGISAFYNCTGLTSVTIGNSVTTIGISAFFGCSGLTSVAIPNSVTTIGESAFSWCSGLTKTNYTGTIADWCKIKFGNSNANPMSYSHNFYINDVEIKDLVIPEGVDTIGDYAFEYCTGLTLVTIPNSVTTIGEGAFRNCSGLTSITIPNSVTTIGSSAFYYCSGLTSVTIGNSVTTIGDYAFEDCSGLTSVTIPNSVTTIEKYAFAGCNGLTSITIPNSVTKIGSSAFYDCSGLTSVTIGNSVTTIGISAFYNCTGLTSVTIGNSVTTIGNYAFHGCSGLTSITCSATTPPTCGSGCFDYVTKSIPVYVHARLVDAYKNAYEWKDFTNLQANPDDFAIVTCNVIGNGTQIGAGTYIKGDTCTLTITFDAGYQLSQWNDGNTDNPRSFVVTQDTTFIAQIDIASSGQCGDNLMWKYGEGVLVISGTGAMYDYAQGTAPWMLFLQESISSLVINNGCTSIGNYAFYGLSNKNFKTIDIPNGVEQIGQFAFANCEYVKNVYLGLSLEKISANAFANDERLLYITCYAIEPPLLDESAFVNYDAYLSVPCVSLADYKVAKGWKLFNKENVSCIGAEEKPITGDEVTVNPSADNVTITWPANDNASEYKLVITKDGIVFCTLTFNAQGQLTGIAFVPNRAGSRMLDAAVMTATGWQFMVTGLDIASKYGYALDALNASKQSIKHYEGEFATDGYTSLEWVTSDKIQGINKMLLDGHLYILRNNNLYTATGARVK